MEPRERLSPEASELLPIDLAVRDWARVFALLDMRPVPGQYLPAGGDRVVVIGRYQGTARATGRPLSAAFAHILRFDGGLVTELVQITETERWHEALAASGRAVQEATGTLDACP